ncbi:MAG TPA: Mur ligase family protein [Candidatus Saccharimonadia bacterium]|nr:Mur ligase family protein [Candidatus Saccharimonadia bacterium]
MIRRFFSIYSPKLSSNIIYMLQRCEYEVKPYFAWLVKTTDYGNITKRGDLVKTSKAVGLLTLLRCGISFQLAIGIYFLFYAIDYKSFGYLGIGLALFLTYPLIWAVLITWPLLLARWFIVRPKEALLVSRSKQIFASYKGKKIAVAGSYGKTTMKELLATVLSEAGQVAATPGNKNVASSHAVFAQKLSGKEKFVIVEFGEGKSGDIKKFASTIKPDVGVITGIAPAHLNKYADLKAAATDIFCLSDFVDHSQLYVNGESEDIGNYIDPKDQVYTAEGISNWQVSSVISNFDGIAFKLTNKKDDKQVINIKSCLLGRHQIGPLSAVAVIAFNNGCSINQIEKGFLKTKPFEHRMELRQIGLAQVIDDTYNGNIEGIAAGLNLLSELPANRKIYVTPGLVDQGIETERVHIKMGSLISEANPDKVVLMKNSVTDYIIKGLGDYKGQMEIIDDPLHYYQNIDKTLAKGDLLLMQNDWPDNYK